MRWYHAAILALGLALAGVLAGGIYEVRPAGESQMILYRTNRLTGTVAVCVMMTAVCWKNVEEVP